jgi:hypothetical protein
VNPLEMLLTAALGGVMGGGSIAALSYRALKDKLTTDLRPTFAMGSDLDRAVSILSHDLDGVGSRVNALESVAIMAKDTADAATDRIIRMEEADHAMAARLAETLTRLERQLRDMDTRHRLSQKELDRTVALLDALEKRIDRHFR